jgi:shikimate kinase
MRIYLVGFTGSGKTTLGSAVAENLHVPFIDTDAFIEASEQVTVHDIFAEKGELYFRELESQVITGTHFFQKALIATGGGLPCFHNNMERMRAEGITIYLEWPWEQLRQHLASESFHDRPLLAGERDDAYWRNIKSLFESRRPVYEQAAMTIEMSGDLVKDEATLMQACNYIWK